MKQYIYGKNSIQEWLASGLEMDEIFISRELKPANSKILRSLAIRHNVVIRNTDRQSLTRRFKNDNHQGVAASVKMVPYASLTDIFKKAESCGEPPLVAVLDGVQDPQNLGAILRSVDGAGFHGVIIPKDNASGLTPVVFKTSAGAAAHVPIVRVTNIARILKHLKDEGFWITGTDQMGSKTYKDVDYTGPVAIVMGSEGKGMRRLIAESCDFLVSIPMFGKVNSLNVSVAAALLFFEVRQQRNKVDK